MNPKGDIVQRLQRTHRYRTAESPWNGLISGVLLIGPAMTPGPIKATYAGWNRYVF